MGDGVAKTNGDDWTIPCSDEEMGDDWEPAGNEILELYQMLDKKQMLDLEWQCPGRRSPSVHANESDSNERRSLDDSESNKPSEPNDFEFEDEITKTATKITPRRRMTPGSSARRVASLDKVMFDIARYRKLDELESQKTSASPTLGKKTSDVTASTTNEKHV